MLYFCKQYHKDPTIHINDHLFVVGDGMAKAKAKMNKAEGSASVPYHWQHNYWSVYILIHYYYICILYQIFTIFKQ